MFKICTLACVILVIGCATTPEPQMVESKVVSPAFYTLKEGAVIPNKAPLPSQTKIFVNWTYSDGGKSSQEGFRGWDIDRDGNFDMLEALDAEGKPYMWAYDFDGNGVIDAVADSSTKKAKINSAQGGDLPFEVAHH